jgi:hypothetical protein
MEMPSRPNISQYHLLIVSLSWLLAATRREEKQRKMKLVGEIETTIAAREVVVEKLHL